MVDHRGRKPHDPDYGLGEHTIDLDDLGLIDEHEMTERLVRTFESPSYRPPRLPAVATELLALSQNPDVEFVQIEEVLEQDAMLAGEVLSIARSALYSGARPVASLHEALVRLGLNRLQQVVMQAAMDLRVFRSASYGSHMERLRHHSRATAHLSRIVSMYTPIGEEQAFLCGLMHDVGFAGILLVLGDVGRGAKPPDLVTLWPAINAAHAKAGARMVSLWDLPPDVALAVAAHHQLRIDGFDHPLAATVCLGEALTGEIGMSLLPDESEGTRAAGSALLLGGRVDRTDEATLRRAREALGLNDETLELIRSAARDWAEQNEPAPAAV